jgi:hypothetical protein
MPGETPGHKAFNKFFLQALTRFSGMPSSGGPFFMYAFHGEDAYF